MALLTSAGWAALLEGFEREALHLEMRDVYTMAAEQESYGDFLAGRPRGREQEAERRKEWLSLVRQAVTAGKAMRRARIVSEPVSDYVRWEWHGSELSIEAGEEIRWLTRQRVGAIGLPANDFWLFDGRTLVVNIFDGDGRLIDNEVSTESDLVDLCSTAFEKVWAKAITHRAYCPL
ncbi:DUF6879 family protein [Nonomuraea sp. NPDC026600]|uniref:DUF6879 family protein n=1 Tax=Nonomuraea sp. NPDC026600 TaxID=3155363 RepID=UPI0033F74593